MEKRCFKCGETKSLDDFYKHPTTVDGRLGKCKECAKQDTRDNYRADPSKAAARAKSYCAKPDVRKRLYAKLKERRANDSLHFHAREMVSNAIKLGWITRASECSQCSSTEKIEGHHEDYTRPLDVIWLCFKCHRILHGQTILTTIEE